MLDPAQLNCFFAQQLMLVGTYDENGKENFSTVSWVSFTLGEPPCLVMSIHGEISVQRNIEKTKRLSATIVTPELLRFMEVCGRAELKERYYDRIKPPITTGKLLDVPLVKDAKWSYECQLYHMVKLGRTTTYFVEIRHVNVSDDILALDFIDLRKISPVVYAHNNYFAIGDHLGEFGGFSGPPDV
jgi:flavin reductase (DIM6/NTAB) family NADH-FMN oxidoreductase RutF